jgi:membrane protease YdiL (CAAX protease family)
MTERTEGQDAERLAWLAGLPVAATLLYYVLPTGLQHQVMLQFLPQALAYLGLAIWARHNRGIVTRLGLDPPRFRQGLGWGLVTGLTLGSLNVSVILWIVPWLGGDITFLRETPHARMPTALMLPWAIVLIAVFVEVNFRGFLLGRLTALFRSSPGLSFGAGSAMAVAGSSLAFSFDPFMVATFKHLHWIAVWDGMVWGLLWLRLRNLYATIVAHAVEVVIMYSVLKATLE